MRELKLEIAIFEEEREKELEVRKGEEEGVIMESLEFHGWSWRGERMRNRELKWKLCVVYNYMRRTHR